MARTIIATIMAARTTILVPRELDPPPTLLLEVEALPSKLNGKMTRRDKLYGTDVEGPDKIRFPVIYTVSSGRFHLTWILSALNTNII